MDVRSLDRIFNKSVIETDLCDAVGGGGSLGSVAGRGVGSLDRRSADVGRSSAPTSPRRKATVQRDRTAEERQLIAVAHEDSHTYHHK